MTLCEPEPNAESTVLYAVQGAELSGFDFEPGPNLIGRADPGPLIEQAAPNASFIQAFSKIGLMPDAGGSWLLVQKLGLARAMGLALSGDKQNGLRLSGVNSQERLRLWLRASR